MKKPVPGILSGMDFLLARTTRTRQRWRDGAGAFDSYLRRDVAAINKRHFCCYQLREATTTRQDIDRHDHAAKSEGATQHQPRFAAPRRRRWTLTLTCVAGFTRRAQDIKASYANPKGGSFPALALCIRRLYVKHRHTHNRRSRQRLNGTARGRCTFRLPMHQQPANGERLMA